MRRVTLGRVDPMGDLRRIKAADPDLRLAGLDFNYEHILKYRTWAEVPAGPIGSLVDTDYEIGKPLAIIEITPLATTG
jgi:hypothetical protein